MIMKDKSNQTNVKPPDPKEMFVIDPVTGKPRSSFTLAEFAELHGNERDWAYKKFKQGKLKCVTELGQVRVLASEFYRMQREATHRADALREGKVYYV